MAQAINLVRTDFLNSCLSLVNTLENLCFAPRITKLRQRLQWDLEHVGFVAFIVPLPYQNQSQTRPLAAHRGFRMHAPLNLPCKAVLYSAPASEASAQWKLRPKEAEHNEASHRILHTSKYEPPFRPLDQWQDKRTPRKPWINLIPIDLVLGTESTVRVST